MTVQRIMALIRKEIERQGDDRGPWVGSYDHDESIQIDGDINLRKIAEVIIADLISE